MRKLIYVPFAALPLLVLALIWVDRGVDSTTRAATAAVAPTGGEGGADGDEDEKVDRKKVSRERSEEGEAAYKESERGKDDDGEPHFTREAREWLVAGKTDHKTWELPKDWARKLTDDLYAAGAEKVLLVRVTPEELVGVKFELANELLCVLPRDKTKRAACIKAWNTALGAHNKEEHVEDVGQKYLYLMGD